MMLSSASISLSKSSIRLCIYCSNYVWTIAILDKLFLKGTGAGAEMRTKNTLDVWPNHTLSSNKTIHL
jgi:hypothetical protein